jgi:acyl-CoA synthetase (AMP-forming)/AMP-acid ligase II
MSSTLQPPQLAPLDVQLLPTLHGSKSTTYTRPPLDGSLSLPEIYAFHARKSPLHPLFIFPVHDKKANTSYTRKICYPEAYSAMLKVQAIIAARIPDHDPSNYASHADEGEEGSRVPPPVVGILAVADSITMFTLMIAIMGLGLTPFPISTRNSIQAVAHLMKESNVSHLFVSADPAMQRLASEATKLAHASTHEVIHVYPVMRFDEIYSPSCATNDASKNTSNDALSKAHKPPKPRMDDVAIILHSSGKVLLLSN